MTKTFKLLSLSLLWATVLLSGCNKNTTQNGTNYDENSWKEIISADCTHFFDWCNNCTRLEWEEGASCTKMYCETYSEPKCTDWEIEWEVANEIIYDENSWKEIIPADCNSYFDWCNYCSKVEWRDDAVCTLRYCETYEEPRCTDWEIEWEVENEVIYDENSRKDIIPADCNSYFDWCNNCSRVEWSDDAACEMKYCETYEEPKCLD